MLEKDKRGKDKLTKDVRNLFKLTKQMKTQVKIAEILLGSTKKLKQSKTK